MGTWEYLKGSGTREISLGLHLRCGLGLILSSAFAYNTIEVLVQSVANYSQWSQNYGVQKIGKEAIPRKQCSTQSGDQPAFCSNSWGEFALLQIRKSILVRLREY